MSTDAKGEKKATDTTATDITKQSTATGLKEFLSNLATDPRNLGEFLHEPEAAMSAANLSEADKAALRSGVSGMVAARLAGVPLDEAFQPKPPFLWMVQASQAAGMQGAPQPPFIYQIVAAPQAAGMQGTPQPPFLNWMVAPPLAAGIQGAPQPPFLNWMVAPPLAAGMQGTPQPPFVQWMVAAPQAAGMKGTEQPAFVHWMVAAPQADGMKGKEQPAIVKG